MKGEYIMNYCLFHKNCMDGFASAWVVWKKYQNDCNFIPVNYGEEPPLMNPVGNVIIVDFSYKREILQILKNRLATSNKNLLVIDHHATAEKEIGDLSYCLFDNNHSGCVLTWKTLFPEDNVPRLLEYIEDRDLWKFNLRDSKVINEGIQMCPKDEAHLIENFIFFDAIVNGGDYEIRQLHDEGNSIINYKNKLISEMVKNVQKIEQMKLGEYDKLNVGFINCGVGSLISDVGNICLTDLDVVIVYSINLGGNNVNCSLRGNSKVDCGLIAKTWNGGGHKNAAGFKCSIDEFINNIFIRFPFHEKS